MLHGTKYLIMGLGLIAASASAERPKATQDQTKYCFQVEASTGTRISKTECRTKAEWAQLGVDVDEILKK